MESAGPRDGSRPFPSLACSYIMIYLQKRNIFAEINKFQYTLLCGSDSVSALSCRRCHFNTHSPAGVIPMMSNLLTSTHFNTHSPAGVIRSVPDVRSLADFNTHSPAGVIQRHLPNLNTKNYIIFVRLLNTLYAL